MTESSSSSTVAAARRLVESLIIAVVTSTGVYLVGSIYTEAYFGRMSIDANALDYPPTYVALQAVHAVQSLLVIPGLLLLLWLGQRAVVARWPEAWSSAARRLDRLGPIGPLVANVAVTIPLALIAAAAGSNRTLIQTTSALSEVVSLLQLAGGVLLAYAVWLGLGPRQYLLAELRQRRMVPTALLVAIYLLAALVNTADRARANAERLMTGASDTSLAVTFTMAAGEQPVSSAELILVALRNGHYFVVERQPDPPSLTPRAYAVPFRAVDAVQLQRINPAAPGDYGIVIGN